MGKIYDIADEYVGNLAQLDPVWATFAGVTGHDSGLTDYSVEGEAARFELDRVTFERLNGVEPADDRERLARAVMLERLARTIKWHENDEAVRDLSVMASPVQAIRGCFDEMGRDSSGQWETIAARMAEVPGAVRSYMDSLCAGLEKGVTASRRQALAAARQARAWAGIEPGSARFFNSLAGDYEARAGWDRKVADSLRKNAIAADNAYDELATFLTDEYAPSVPDIDGVGRERYADMAAHYLGDEIDLDATYAWGWQEFHRVLTEVKRVCEEIAPGQTLRQVIDLLDDDHERWVNGERALTQWLQGLLDHTIQRLHGKHFDIPDVLRNIEVRIPVEGGPLHQYYTPPSEDFRRPGIYWHPTGGRTRFMMWSEISTAYHEGVPGHHLQLGYVRFLADELSRFQRNLSVPGHSEGWALYAERLMDDLGCLERPEYRLDMLLNSLHRAARVVIDIGLHLGLSIPEAESFHGGEIWTPEIAAELLESYTSFPPDMIISEVDRYLGVPGQAISYKLGEKAWVEARDARRTRDGDDFDPKQFHKEALALGPMGLAQLRHELGAS